MDIVPHEPGSLNDLLKLLVEAADLISLTMGVPAYFKNLSAQFQTPEGDTVWADLWIRGLNNGEFEPLDFSRMLFRFCDVRDRFPSLVQAWWNRLKVIEPNYQLYFATIRANGMYAEHRLFNLFQALESYHQRAKFPDGPEKRKPSRRGIEF